MRVVLGDAKPMQNASGAAVLDVEQPEQQMFTAEVVVPEIDRRFERGRGGQTGQKRQVAPSEPVGGASTRGVALCRDRAWLVSVDSLRSTSASPIRR